MGRVHLFSTLTTVYGDTKLSGQTPGNSASPSPFQVSLNTILTWLAANLTPDTTAAQTVASGGTLTVPAATLVDWIVVVSDGTARTINIGTSTGGTDVADGEALEAAVDLRLLKGLHKESGALTLHFSGFTGNIQVKLYTRL